MTVGRPNRPLWAGSGGLARTIAALALEAFEQRGLLAADIGAGADPHLHVEGESAESATRGPRMPPRRAASIAASIAAMACGIFGADVDVALGRADGDAGDDHALDQDEGIAFHDHAVGEGAAVALVGVADDVFLRARRRPRRSAT